MPTKFWNDKQNKKYKLAYFTNSKEFGIMEILQKKTDNSFIIYGRSDATLNPGGVRLGTSEIYSVVEKFIEIKESLVIGQNWNNDIRIVLFIILKIRICLNDKIKKRIKSKYINFYHQDMFQKKLFK